MKQTNCDIIYKIVKQYQPIRTELVEQYVNNMTGGTADRCLRKLQQQGKIYGKFINDDKTKTWFVKSKDIEYVKDGNMVMEIEKEEPKLL